VTITGSDAPAALAPRVVSPDVELLVDATLGVVGASLRLGRDIARATVRSPAPRLAAALCPPFVRTRVHPRSAVLERARVGAHDRARAAEAAGRLLDAWFPVVVEHMMSRLDLTGIVLRHVAIDDVVRTVDLDAAVARVDVDAIVRSVDLDAIVQRIDADAIAARLDLDAVIGRVDLVALVDEVLVAIDLPAIIRDSAGSLTGETVRSARMSGISADEAINRAVGRYLFPRRHRPALADPQ
jgi:hypothetical protein